MAKKDKEKKKKDKLEKIKSEKIKKAKPEKIKPEKTKNIKSENVRNAIVKAANATKAPIVKKISAQQKITNLLKEIDDILKTLDTPTLLLISNGIGDDKRIKMEMKWNNAFIKNVNKNGIAGATEEETAMLFLVGCQLKPEEFPGHDDEVVSSAHPLLSADTNLLKR